jgi:large subunit ribosomal protein L10
MVKALEIKKEMVAKITKEIETAKVIAVVDLHNLPGSLLHSMRKGMKGHGKVIIYKTNLLKKALKRAKKDALIPVMTGEKALLISDMDPFMLYKKMNENPLKVYAKEGQIAPYDIIVPAGETQLAPGPALTELKTAGIDARIMAGKIAVGKDSTVAKKGEAIKGPVSKALQKLGIKPFEVRVHVPLALEGSISYSEELLNVDEKKLMADLIGAHMGARAVAMEIGFVTKDTIGPLIQKAFRQAKHVGIEKDIMVPQLMEELVKKAARQANAMNATVPQAA